MIKIFINIFDQFDIEDIFIRIPGKTRNNFKITELANGDTTDINLEGATIGDLAYKLFFDQLHNIGSTNSQCLIAVLASSLPKNISDDFFIKCLNLLSSYNVFTVVDTSGHPLELLLNNSQLPNVLKPNIYELREVAHMDLNTNQEIINYTKNWFDKGLDLLVIFKGAEGALFITKTEIIQTTPPKVNVVSTVGAGDSMVSSIVSSLISGKQIQGVDLQKIAMQATALSALVFHQ